MRSTKFFESLITNLKSKFRNSKLRIQYGRPEFKKRYKSYENVYLRFSGLLIMNPRTHARTHALVAAAICILLHVPPSIDII